MSKKEIQVRNKSLKMNIEEKVLYLTEKLTF